MFFWCYSEWEWNKVAIKLYEIEDEPDNPINKDNWQGKAEDFKNGKIFVITPSFPCMNSSHNITESSFIVLKDLI
jgi:poly(A) polymerase Pap1